MAAASIAATGSTSQRKLLLYNGSCSPQDCLVYESVGDIWFTRSTDYGATWSPERMISRGAGTAHNPSLAESANNCNASALYVFWIDNTVRSGATGYDINVRRLDLSTGQWGTIEYVYNPSYPTAAGLARAGALPVGVFVSEVSQTKLIVAYEGAGTGIRYDYKSWDSGLQTDRWYSNTIGGTGTSDAGPSMTWVLIGASSAKAALTFGNGSNYNVSRCESNLFAWNQYYNYYASFTAPEVVPSSPSSYCYGNTVVASDAAGRQHIMSVAYNPEYETPVILHRYKSSTGTWSSIYQFVDDIYYGAPLSGTIGGHQFDGDGGASLLISDGSILFNLAATSGNNWTIKSYSTFGVSIGPPNFVAKGDDFALGNVLSKNNASPYGILFQERDNGLAKASLTEKVTRYVPKTRFAQRLELRDTLTGQYLALCMQGAHLTAGSTEQELSFVDDRERTDIQTNPVRLQQQSTLSVDVILSGTWNKGGRALLELVDAAEGKVLSTIKSFSTAGMVQSPIKQRISWDGTANDVGRNYQIRMRFENDANVSLESTVINTIFFEPSTDLQKTSSENVLARRTEDLLPKETTVLQNYPNPFNPSTTFSYQLAEDALVKLEVYDMMGRRISSLVDGVKTAGYHSALWQSRDESGKQLASGIYLYRFTAVPTSGKQPITRSGKLMLMK